MLLHVHLIQRKLQKKVRNWVETWIWISPSTLGQVLLYNHFFFIVHCSEAIIIRELLVISRGSQQPEVYKVTVKIMKYHMFSPTALIKVVISIN